MKRFLIIAAVILFLAAVLMTSSNWDGDITEGAADPLAARAGRQVTNLLPWNLTGDLELFIFFSGGAAAGFAAGYFWRKLFSEPGAAAAAGHDNLAPTSSRTDAKHRSP